MHYCQNCEDPQLMQPAGYGVARCPVCGSTDPTARRLPLFVVTGASGSGKTAAFPVLLQVLRGTCAVFDVDWLIDPFGRQPNVSDIDWPSLRDTWLHVAHGVAQNGQPTLLLAPFIPAQLEGLPGRRWVGGVHFLVLDCPDDVRRRRLEARPKWRRHDIEAQVAFGRWLRTNVAPVLDTSVGPPAATAQAVSAWVRGILSADAPMRPAPPRSSAGRPG